MSRTLIELTDRIVLDPAAVNVVAAHKNMRPWRCAETGRTYDAQLRIETYHDVYRVPFESIGEAQQVLRLVLSAMRQANTKADALGGRLAERESPRAAKASEAA